MTELPPLIPSFYSGWHTYQTLLIKALTPLSTEQLALRAAPSLRSVEEIATHMIGARARWFYQLMVRLYNRFHPARVKVTVDQLWFMDDHSES